MGAQSTNESHQIVLAAEKKDPQPKFIVLDSNVFIRDYWLRSPSVVLLRDFLGKTNATLVVPKIVLEEVINHQKEDVDRVKSDIRKALREANRVVRNVPGPDASIIAVSQQSSDDPYSDFLGSELSGLNAKIVDYGDIPHSE